MLTIVSAGVWVGLAGLVAGCLHVVSGPDHLVALAPIAAVDRSRAARVGLIWGLGHGLGVAAVGGPAILAKQAVPVETLSLWSEFIVGLTLMLIGGWAVWKATRVTVHSHAHTHDAHAQGEDHEHVHVHTSLEHRPEEHVGHAHAALGVGFLHGAAGTGHLFGVMPALALPAGQAVLYILAYLCAAVISMGLFGSVLGLLISRGGQVMVRGVMITSGVLAIGLGVWWSAMSWPL